MSKNSLNNTTRFRFPQEFIRTVILKESIIGNIYNLIYFMDNKNLAIRKIWQK